MFKYLFINCCNILNNNISLIVSFCLFLILLSISNTSSGQDIFVGPEPSLYLEVQTGGTLSLNGVSLTPSAALKITNNTFNKSNSVSNTLNSSINRSYLFSNNPINFSGDLSIYYNDSELNGQLETDLKIFLFDGTKWNPQSSTASDTSSNYVTINASNHLILEATLSANSAPTDIVLSPSNVDENVTLGTIIGTLSSTDANSADNHTYALIPGSGNNDNSSFTISGTLLLTSTPLDYESKSTYSILVQSLDGTLSYSKTLTITVNDVFEDMDNDGVSDQTDNCPTTANADQLDTDADGVGDVCDNTPTLANADQIDTDGDREEEEEEEEEAIDADDDKDGCPNIIDVFPLDPNECSDYDGDGLGDNADLDNDNDTIPDKIDNCPTTLNTDQKDTDEDGIGNVCDLDDDGDGFSDEVEITCGSDPLLASSLPADADSDGIANCIDTDDDSDGFSDEDEIACGSDPLDEASKPIDTDLDGIANCIDTDKDNDGILDTEDAFPLDATEWLDTDLNGIGNNADMDDDGDGFSDLDELACDSDPLNANDRPEDLDADGIADCIDTDIDGDGCLNTEDVFPRDPSECEDSDRDGLGDNVDVDDDNDGVIDQDDAFPLDSNESKDSDGDGIGDNADPDDNNDGFEDDKVFTSGVLTPGSGGLESTWKIINIDQYPTNRVSVYDKNGNVVFSDQNYKNNWRGTFKNSANPLPAGSYYYVIDLNNGQDQIKGWLYITY